MSERVEILRRACDLLVGDVVAHEGRPHTVESVFESRWPYDGETCFVTFEDASLVERKRQGVPTGEMKKKPIAVSKHMRFLLLESHYTMKGVGGE